MVIVKKGSFAKEPSVRSPRVKWRLLLYTVSSCCLNIRHVSQPELKLGERERKEGYGWEGVFLFIFLKRKLKTKYLESR